MEPPPHNKKQRQQEANRKAQAAYRARQPVKEESRKRAERRARQKANKAAAAAATSQVAAEHGAADLRDLQAPSAGVIPAVTAEPTAAVAAPAAAAPAPAAPVAAPSAAPAAAVAATLPAAAAAVAAPAAAAAPAPAAITDIQNWEAVAKGAPTLPLHKLQQYLPLLGIPTLLSCHQALQEATVFKEAAKALDRLADLIKPCMPHKQRNEHSESLKGTLRLVLVFARGTFDRHDNVLQIFKALATSVNHHDQQHTIPIVSGLSNQQAAEYLRHMESGHQVAAAAAAAAASSSSAAASSYAAAAAASSTAAAAAGVSDAGMGAVVFNTKPHDPQLVERLLCSMLASGLGPAAVRLTDGDQTRLPLNLLGLMLLAAMTDMAVAVGVLRQVSDALTEAELQEFGNPWQSPKAYSCFATALRWAVGDWAAAAPTKGRKRKDSNSNATLASHTYRVAYAHDVSPLNHGVDPADLGSLQSALQRQQLYQPASLVADEPGGSTWYTPSPLQQQQDTTTAPVFVTEEQSHDVHTKCDLGNGRVLREASADQPLDFTAVLLQDDALGSKTTTARSSGRRVQVGLGVLLPVMIISMIMTATQLHIEDAGLNALNELVWGAYKLWLLVPNRKVWAAVQKYAASVDRKWYAKLLTKQLVPHTLSLCELLKCGVVPFVQEPGMMVATSRCTSDLMSMHVTVSAGFSMALSSNCFYSTTTLEQHLRQLAPEHAELQQGAHKSVAADMRILLKS